MFVTFIINFILQKFKAAWMVFELEKMWPANSLTNWECFENHFILERTTDELFFCQLPVSILQIYQRLLAYNSINQIMRLKKAIYSEFVKVVALPVEIFLAKHAKNGFKKLHDISVCNFSFIPIIVDLECH